MFQSPFNKIEDTTSPGITEMKNVPPVYIGGARLINWGNTAKGGMTIEIMLKDIGPKEVNPFKGLKFGKSNGQRLKTWIGPYSETAEITQIENETLESLYKNESLLLFYGDTCTKGVTIKILLDCGPDGENGKHPFDGMTTGKVEGEDLYASFWLINDDENIIPKAAIKTRTPFHQLSEVKQSNILVRDAEFVNFLSNRVDQLVGITRTTNNITEKPTDWAIEIVRLFIGVETRSIMNEDNHEGLAARKKWKILMSSYFQSPEYHSRRPFYKK